MPRPQPNKEELLKIYLKDCNIVKIDNENEFNANTKITLGCIMGHNYFTSITRIRRGQDPHICVYCSKEKKDKEVGIPYKVIEEYAIKNNLTFLLKKDFYNRWTDKIEFSCKNDNYKFTIKSLSYWEENNVNTPFECPKCHKKSLGLLSPEEFSNKIKNLNSDKIKITPNFENAESIFNQPISELLLNKFKPSKWFIFEYNGTRYKGKFICKLCGNIKECYPHSLFIGKGGGCQNCESIRARNGVYEKIKHLCTVSDVFPIKDTPYTDIKIPIEYKCNKCGTEFNRLYCIEDRITCPNCFKSTKRASQNEVYDWITKELNIPATQDDRTNGFEIDIFSKEKNIGIEYCGLIWHSTKYKPEKDIHKIKLDKCKEKGIRLLTIFEDEWKEHLEICKSRIKNCLGLTNERYFARKLDIKKIDNFVALKFCSENHIQGKGHTYESYGLLNKDELISVMTFSKPSIVKNANKYEWELNRFCSKINTNVVGGASRLLSEFKKHHIGDKIITFCDLRWGTGIVYEKMGFKFVENTRPNYYYFGKVTDWRRKHRFNFNKQRLLKMLPNEDKHKTEFQLADDNGLFRIFDCGHMKFEMVC